MPIELVEIGDSNKHLWKKKKKKKLVFGEYFGQP
jgi:hypothetical protein